MTTIFRITPLDRKGEQNGNFIYTQDPLKVFEARCNGWIVDGMRGEWEEVTCLIKFPSDDKDVAPDAAGPDYYPFETDYDDEDK